MIIQTGIYLSDLFGAHWSGDTATTIEEVSPTSPPLKRGSIVCKGNDGFVTLAGSQGSDENSVYGIVLDTYVDPSMLPGTVSVARNGVYSAEFLTLEGNQDIRPYEKPLRSLGIHLEKVNLWAGINPPPREPTVESETEKVSPQA